MKKVFIKVIGSILIGVSILGCSKGTKVDRIEKEETKVENKVVSKEQKEREISKFGFTKEEEKEFVTSVVNNINLNWNLETDSIGTVWTKGYITNGLDSKYAILSTTFTVEYTNESGLKEKNYLMFYDTVLSGENSPVSECFGNTDNEFVSASYEILDNETGTKYYIDFDNKTKMYHIY